MILKKPQLMNVLTKLQKKYLDELKDNEGQKLLEWMLKERNNPLFDLNKLHLSEVEKEIEKICPSSVPIHYENTTIGIFDQIIVLSHDNDIVIPLELSTDTDFYKEHILAQSHVTNFFDNLFNIKSRDISSIISEYSRVPIGEVQITLNGNVCYKEKIWKFPFKFEEITLTPITMMFTQIQLHVMLYKTYSEDLILFTLKTKKMRARLPNMITMTNNVLFPRLQRPFVVTGGYAVIVEEYLAIKKIL